MYIIPTILLLATAAPSSNAHTFLRKGNLPSDQQYVATTSTRSIAPPLPDESNTPLQGTRWTATDLYYEEDDELKPALDGHPATLIFEDWSFPSFEDDKADEDTVSLGVDGNTGCNTINGMAAVSPSTFEVSDARMTMKICEDTVMQQETAFRILFQQSVTYEIQESEPQVLVFKDEETEEVIARFEPLPEPTLESDWVLDGVVPEGGWDRELTDTDEPVTLSFNSDGTYSGYGGCNSFNGEYEDITIEGSHYSMFRTTKFVSTKRLCEDEVNDQERKMFDALRQEVTAYRLNDPRFEHSSPLELLATTVNSDSTGKFQMVNVDGDVLAGFSLA